MFKLSLKMMLLLAAAGLIAGCGKSEEAPPKDDGAQAGGAVTIEGEGRTGEIAVSLKQAVAYLKDSQNEDGSFGKMQPGVGITSMVVYGLARGPLAADPDTRAVIDRGVEYMLGCVRENGSINNDSRMLATYRTSLSLLALNAVDPEKHRDIIVGAQNYLKGTQFMEENGDYTPDDWQYGGWRYSDRSDDILEEQADPDMSNVHFVLQALHESGLPPEDEAFKRALQFLQRSQNRSESNDLPTAGDDGGGIYSPKDSKAGTITLEDGTVVYKSYGSMTYALLKSFLFAGLPTDDPRVKAAYGWITENFSVDENPGMGYMGLFYYFLTMARSLEAYGVDIVETPDGRRYDWRKELAGKIISTQKEDGSWTNVHDRWMEGDPDLVTGYALTVLSFCVK